MLSRSEAATDLIAEFPGPITLRPSRLKWWSVAAIGAGMTALCIWLAIFFELHPERVEGNPHVGMAALLCCAAIFAIGALVPFAALRRGCLSLSADSFEVTDMRGRTTVYNWNHVSDFQVVYDKGAYVAFSEMKEREPSLAGGAYWPGMEPTTPKAHTSLVLEQTFLPDSYGLSVNDLTCLMEGWRTLANEASSKQMSLPD